MDVGGGGVAGRYHRMRTPDKILLAPTGHLISAEGWDCAIRIYRAVPTRQGGRTAAHTDTAPQGCILPTLSIAGPLMCFA